VTASTEPPGDRAPSEARRAGRELVLELGFRPLANALVPVLRRLGLSPPVVVLLNAVAGVAAAAAIASGALLAGALLVQLKTLLDNSDGQLARSTGRVTLAGRYLDTIADLVVNAALLAAVGYVTGKPVLALAAFLALTLVLAADYNATELYRAGHGAPTPQPSPTGSRYELALARTYAAVFSPLDRLFHRLFGQAGVDRLAVKTLANLGLSTQLLVLGVCLVLDEPAAYLWFALACVLVVGVLLTRAQPLRRRRAA
jgi:archaetidylinositol phosphate synthase